MEHVLTTIVAKRGEPDGEALRELRAEQAKVAAAPSHRRLAEVAAGRCAKLPAGEGISDIGAILVPVTGGEAEQFGVPVGERMPVSVGRKVRLATTGTVESLLADGVVPSAEVLAELIPALTGQQVSAAYNNPDLGRLSGAVYEAFRRRRSLLLLDLSKQVQFEELPWVSVLTPHAATSGSGRSTAVARRVAALAIDAFPGTILPNPLIRELITLYDAAGQSLPLTQELAADIFMGTFSPRFAAAAQVAATMLRGTLYERYYGLPFELLLDAKAADPARGLLVKVIIPRPKQTAAETVFEEICAAAAQGFSGWSPSRNGMVIERQQLLTTQNLAVLITDGGVQPSRSWPDLALAAALHCARLLRVAQGQRRPLATIKDAAYAWRQALFFLTMAGADEHLAKLVDAVGETAGGGVWPMTEVLEGLRFVGRGGTFDEVGRSLGGRRLLGWTMTPHWAAARQG